MTFVDGQERESTLQRNAFHILGVTTRDRASKIIEVAEERSLFIDAEICSKARAELTSPRTRLAAEVSFLSSLSPSAAATIMESIGVRSAKPSDFNAPPLARANILAARLELGLVPPEDMVMAVIDLANSIEEIDVEQVMRDINEDRAIAGVAPVPEPDLVLAELQARRRFFRGVAYAALDVQPSKTLVATITSLAEMSTGGGSVRPPSLIEDIIDDYEANTQEFISNESKTLKIVLALAQRSAERESGDVDAVVNRIRTITENWNRILAPVQILGASKGLDHEPSVEVAVAIRSLSIELYNKFNLDSISQELTALGAFLRSTGSPAWRGRLADVEPDLDAFAARFTNWKRRDPDAGGYGQWLNPLGRWDWWELGGRFDGQVSGQPRRGAGSESMISSGPNKGRDLLGGVAKALGGKTADVKAEIAANVDLVSALLEAARRGEEHACPTAVVLPVGACADSLRWFDSLGWRPISTETKALLSVPDDADFKETATAAWERFEGMAVAGVAYHF